MGELAPLVRHRCGCCCCCFLSFFFSVLNVLLLGWGNRTGEHLFFLFLCFSQPIASIPSHLSWQQSIMVSAAAYSLLPPPAFLSLSALLTAFRLALSSFLFSFFPFLSFPLIVQRAVVPRQNPMVAFVVLGGAGLALIATRALAAAATRQNAAACQPNKLHSAFSQQLCEAGAALATNNPSSCGSHMLSLCALLMCFLSPVGFG